MRKKNPLKVAAAIAQKKIIATQINEGSSLISKLKPFPFEDRLALAVIAEQLLRWVQKTKSLQIEDFALSEGYNPKSLYMCKDPLFADAYDYAKYTLASRMQKEEEQNRRIKWPRLNRMLRIYHAEFKEDDSQKDIDMSSKAILFTDGSRINDTLGMIGAAHVEQS